MAVSCCASAVRGQIAWAGPRGPPVAALKIPKTVRFQIHTENLGAFAAVARFGLVNLWANARIQSRPAIAAFPRIFLSPGQNCFRNCGNQRRFPRDRKKFLHK